MKKEKRKRTLKEMMGKEPKHVKLFTGEIRLVLCDPKFIKADYINSNGK